MNLKIELAKSLIPSLPEILPAAEPVAEAEDFAAALVDAREGAERAPRTRPAPERAQPARDRNASGEGRELEREVEAARETGPIDAPAFARSEAIVLPVAIDSSGVLPGAAGIALEREPSGGEPVAPALPAPERVEADAETTPAGAPMRAADTPESPEQAAPVLATGAETEDARSPAAPAPAPATASARPLPATEAIATPRPSSAEPAARPIADAAGNEPVAASSEPGPQIEIGGWFDDATDREPRPQPGGRALLLDEESNRRPELPLARSGSDQLASSPAATSALPASPAARAGHSATADSSASPAQSLDGIASSPPGRGIAADAPLAEAVLHAEPGDETALLRRLHRLVRRAVLRGESEIQIRLDPPRLGRVDVHLRVDGDRVGILFQVDDREIRSTIARHSDELKQTLDGYGYVTEGIEVDLRNSSDSSPWRSDGQRAAPDARAVASGAAAEAAETREVALVHLGSLMDIVG